MVYYTGAATIAADALAASELNLKKASKNLELGLVSPADVAEIEAQVAANDVSLTEQQNNLSLAEIRLREVMNYPQDEPLEIDTDVRIESELVGASFDEVLDNALANNPRMRSAELNSRYSEINYSITKGRYYPSISAGAATAPASTPTSTTPRRTIRGGVSSSRTAVRTSRCRCRFPSSRVSAAAPRSIAPATT